MSSLPVAVQFRPFKTIALVSVQLALVLLVIQQFQLESRTFFQVMLLASGGFVIHALLPPAYRLFVFTLLSLASIILALGPLDGIYLIALGLVLIGIVHLPVRYTLRLVLLIACGMLFAIWRMELLPAPWSATIWPILASMFMFRLAVYVYTLNHDKKRPTPAQTLAYFFMLPNVCFQLYPVIDYSTFIRTYYDRDAALIYKVGVRWIVRGLFHLILYRFVYLHLAKDPADLRTFGELAQFMIATFMLYFRVSGQFHLIGGILHLYGFHLPQTHNLYYLASGFTDHWRRINIYWKDFMMKVVYYPTYFRLRRWGGNFALVASTIFVFLATWVLHSYQWFWLRGGFPVELQDILFWSIFCGLVMFSTLREMKRPQKRTLGRNPSWSASLAFRRVATFSAICVLWSLWTSESITSWFAMLTVAGNVASTDVWLIPALVLGSVLIAGRAWSLHESDDDRTVPFYRRLSFQSTALLVAILAVGNPVVYEPYVPRLAATVASLQHSTLNARDAALHHKGYYERLDNVSRMSAQLWDVQAKKPANWVPLAGTDAYRLRNDFIGADLRPDVRITFEDRLLTTNRWGMRDRDRTLAKSEGTYRIALLGPSSVMGSGVADDETFATYLEERLNRSSDPGRYARYEVLNFGVAAYSVLQQLALLEERVVAFQPDAVFIIDSSGLVAPTLAHLEGVVLSRVKIPYAGLNAFVRQAGVESLGNPGPPVPFETVRGIFGFFGVTTRMPGREADRRLQPFKHDIVRWTLERTAEVTRAHGAVPVFVMVDVVSDPISGDIPALKDAATAGFLVFNLLDLWQDQDKTALQVADWDEHPNAAGNRIIAARLFDLIQQHKSQLRLTTNAQSQESKP